MLEQVLPVGTVVLLKGGMKRLMIMGYQQSNTENLARVYDYVGCEYPEGFIKVEDLVMFDHQDIEHIFALGLQNEEQVEFRNALENELIRLNLKKNV